MVRQSFACWHSDLLHFLLLLQLGCFGFELQVIQSPQSLDWLLWEDWQGRSSRSGCDIAIDSCGFDQASWTCYLFYVELLACICYGKRRVWICDAPAGCHVASRIIWVITSIDFSYNLLIDSLRCIYSLLHWPLRKIRLNLSFYGCCWKQGQKN